MPAENTLHSDVKTKLNEARLFLNLMHHSEATQQPLITGYGLDAQFSYLLSAFLGACYSVLAYLKEDKLYNEAAECFRKTHPAFYASKRDGGYRTRAIHFSPVVPQYLGFIPPPGNQVNFRFGGGERSKVAGDAVNFEFTSRTGAYYFTTDSPQCSICDLCATHLGELSALVSDLFVS